MWNIQISIDYYSSTGISVGVQALRELKGQSVAHLETPERVRGRERQGQYATAISNLATAVQ